MLFRDLPVVDMDKGLAHLLKSISAAQGIVFVSAKGVEGVKMPLKKVRDEVADVTPGAVFVPVTDNWKDPKSVLAKDVALQLKEDTKSPHPILLSVGKDRYEVFGDKEIDKRFEGNAVVLLHAAPTEEKLDEFLAFHHKTREILGEGKKPKLFPEHILTVMELKEKLPNIPKVFLDAGAGFMVYDQAKYYLDTGVVDQVIAINVTLAKSEKMTIPYVYDNAESMGRVEKTKGGVKLIRKATEDVAEDVAVQKPKSKSKSASKPVSKPKSKSKSKSASKPPAKEKPKSKLA